MDINTITPNLSVSPQITTADVEQLAQAGFKTIICNRPDGESADQPRFHEIEQAAQKLGLHTHFMPVETAKITEADGQAFGQLVHSVPGPVLAYCRSGTRCSILWNLSEAGAPPPPTGPAD
jgi:sulfide:quinone oxidoreductase